MKWTEKELEYIAANAAILTDEEVAVRLFHLTGRITTATAVKQVRSTKLGITKKKVASLGAPTKKWFIDKERLGVKWKRKRGYVKKKDRPEASI